MNNIKQDFSIKDLENLCGIKAHTIRIWEKRYNLLTPNRTETNIRSYDLKSLQKLLNVTYLVNSGYKISRISNLNEEEINEYVRRIVTDSTSNSQSINSLKIAMINYDVSLFQSTYEKLITKRSFRHIFLEIFIPLLKEIGLLWQTNTITPSQEHFITNLIKQKLLVTTEKLQFSIPLKTDKLFVLFLPENEIHELGLLYVNYEILQRGYPAIYLGSSIPLDCLTDMSEIHQNTIFVSYFTIKPEKDKIDDYLEEFNNVVPQSNTPNDLWILGKQITHISQNSASNHRFFNSIQELLLEL